MIESFDSMDDAKKDGEEDELRLFFKLPKMQDAARTLQPVRISVGLDMGKEDLRGNQGAQQKKKTKLFLNEDVLPNKNKVLL